MFFTTEAFTVSGNFLEVSMNIANCDGDFECRTWTELENFIRESSSNSPDDIWISADAQYPCLAILLNGNAACVHYFLDDQGDMWQSVGYGEEDITFVINGEKTDMPADCIISLDQAIECAKQFYYSQDKPSCLKWREL